MSELTIVELLAAADRDARLLLGHTAPEDGPGLAAAWPELLRAAAVLLANVPQPSTPRTSDHRPGLDGHVSGMLAEATAAPPLPLPPPHVGCARIIDTWYQAAAQARRPTRSPTTARDAAALRVDPAALRTRVARTLATVSHVAGREMLAHAQHRLDVDAAGPRPSWVMRKPAPGPTEEQWVRMLHRHEHHALDHLVTSSPGGRTGAGRRQPRPPRPGPALPAEVAAWSIVARRQSCDPQGGAPALHRVALTQRAALYAMAALAHAAVYRGDIPAAASPHLQARIDVAARTWGGMAEQWRWAQVTRSREPTEADAETSRALFTAIDTDLRRRNSWLGPDEVNKRFAGEPLVPMLRTILESNEILAEVHQQLPGQLQAQGRLRAPAATLLQIYRETAHDPSRLTIDPRHLLGDQLRPLTPAAHARLNSAAAALVDSAERAHQALLVSAGPTAAAAAEPATTPALLPTPRHRHRRPLPTPSPGQGIPR